MGHSMTKETGFTLVEILCVLVVIAATTSVVMLSMPPKVSVLEKQAKRLTLEINALAQDGLISGSVTAAGFSKDGYTLYSFENSEWAERVSTQWEEGYRLNLMRGSAKIDVPKTTEPLILFQPTGLSTPFELTLSDREMTYALTAQGDGRVRLNKSLP